MDGSRFQIGLRQFQGRRLEIEAIENDQIGAGKQFAVRRDGLESVRIDPLRDNAGELNFVAGDVFHDAGDRRDSGDDVQFLFRRGGRLLFLAATGSKKKCESQNRQPCDDTCRFHLVRRGIFPFVQTEVTERHEGREG